MKRKSYKNKILSCKMYPFLYKIYLIKNQTNIKYYKNLNKQNI